MKPGPDRRDELERRAGEWTGDNQQWWNAYMAAAAEDPAEATSESAVEPASEDAAPQISLAALARELGTAYPLDSEAVSRFRRGGYVKLRNVVSPAALARLRREMEAFLLAELGEDPGLDFRSAEMMWLRSRVFRHFVLSRRIAEIAAALLGVPRVRLYHDNALSKEPECGRTPWHYDADHFPIASPRICTAWIPLQTVPCSMGPLAFAVGMETWRLVESISFDRFDPRYDRTVGEVFSQRGVEIDDAPFELGEVSFHHSLSFHSAGANRTDRPRLVLATTYFEDGARVVPAPTKVSGDWRKFMPGVDAGETIASPLNPVCFAAERSPVVEGRDAPPPDGAA